MKTKRKTSKNTLAVYTRLRQIIDCNTGDPSWVIDKWYGFGNPRNTLKLGFWKEKNDGPFDDVILADRHRRNKYYYEKQLEFNW